MKNKKPLHVEICKAESRAQFVVTFKKQAEVLAPCNPVYWGSIHQAWKDIDPNTVTDDDIAKLPGSRDRRLHCDICEQSVEIVAQLGEDDDYDADIVDICLNCLKKSVSMIEEDK